MSMKDLLHQTHVSNMGRTVLCTDAAAINAIFYDAGAVDTKGYESNYIILTFGNHGAVTQDMVYTVFETDVSPTDAGTAADHEDVLVMREDGDVTKCPASTGVLTLNHADDEHYCWLFQYIGKKRYFKLKATTGTADSYPVMISVQGNARREPTHA